MLLTRAPLYWRLPSFSLDLHVLSAPLTFVLSQDQTLQCNHWSARHSMPRRLLDTASACRGSLQPLRLHRRVRTFRTRTWIRVRFSFQGSREMNSPVGTPLGAAFRFAGLYSCYRACPLCRESFSFESLSGGASRRAVSTCWTLLISPSLSNFIVRVFLSNHSRVFALRRCPFDWLEPTQLVVRVQTFQRAMFFFRRTSAVPRGAVSMSCTLLSEPSLSSFFRRRSRFYSAAATSNLSARDTLLPRLGQSCADRLSKDKR